MPQADTLPLLYADEALLVLNKPAGLLSVPGRGADKQDCLSARVQRHYPQALVVHRLDMATSGLMLMALSVAVQRTLSIAFAQRQILKRYIAVVAGHLDGPCTGWAEIDQPILLDWPRRPLHIIDPAGKPSLTRWQVLAHGQDDAGRAHTRLALEPMTGRSHQLRVHLQAQGHPILGDALYAPPDVASRTARLLLHACELRLPHPVSGQPLHWTCPPDF